MKNKYKIESTNKFKKSYYKMIKKQGNKEEDFTKVLYMLVNDEILPEKYHNHLLEPKSKRNMGMSYKTRLVIGI